MQVPSRIALLVVACLLVLAGPLEGQEPPAGVDRQEIERIIDEILRKRAEEARQEVPLDPVLVEEGYEAFQISCTLCHTAGRAIDRRKDRAGWRLTVRRMQRKPGAEIPDGEIEPITAYLVSVAGPVPREQDPESSTGEGIGEGRRDAPVESILSQLDFRATFAPVFRGSARNRRLENDGFTAEVWAGVEFHSESRLSARILACSTCHKSSEPEGDRLEIVEAVVRLDLVGKDASDGPRIGVEGGRFLVPFGTDRGRVHLGSQRTATRSLLYNMGQTVNRDEVGPALLPLPYADEGFLIDATVPVSSAITAHLSAYLVNGLQGEGGIDFFRSRDTTDNNNDPAYGARLSVGSPQLQVGGSFTGGRLDRDAERRLGYSIHGVDVTARYKDLLRFQADYARRTSDRLVFLPTSVSDEEEVLGYSLEAEATILRDPGLWALFRFDNLRRDGALPPPGSSLSDGGYTVQRITWGFNFGLPGGSLLVLNHEHWSMPSGLDAVDVIAVRWIASF